MKRNIQISIRNFQKTDITGKYIKALNDKKLMQFSENRHKSFNKKDCLKYYEMMKKSNNYFFLVLKNEKNNTTKTAIGTLSAHVDYNNKRCDLGILIWEKGNGYGKVAWNLAIKKIFSGNKIKKISAGAMENNKAMIEIFKNSKMKFELKKKKHFLYKRKYVDMVGYIIFK